MSWWNQRKLIVANQIRISNFSIFSSNELIDPAWPVIVQSKNRDTIQSYWQLRLLFTVIWNFIRQKYDSVKALFRLFSQSSMHRCWRSEARHNGNNRIWKIVWVSKGDVKSTLYFVMFYVVLFLTARIAKERISRKTVHRSLFRSFICLISGCFVWWFDRKWTTQ